MRQIKPHTIYRHFKGNFYYVEDIVVNCTNGGPEQLMVVYIALYGQNKMYVRDLKEFNSKVDKVKYPNASQEYRFEQYTDIDKILKLFNFQVIFNNEFSVELEDNDHRRLFVSNLRIEFQYPNQESIPIDNNILLLSNIIRGYFFYHEEVPKYGIFNNL